MPTYNFFKIRILQKHVQNTITNAISMNTFVQPRISLRRYEVYSVFLSKKILLINQQLRWITYIVYNIYTFDNKKYILKLVLAFLWHLQVFNKIIKFLHVFMIFLYEFKAQYYKWYCTSYNISRIEVIGKWLCNSAFMLLVCKLCFADIWFSYHAQVFVMYLLTGNA